MKITIIIIIIILVNLKGKFQHFLIYDIVFVVYLFFIIKHIFCFLLCPSRPFSTFSNPNFYFLLVLVIFLLLGLGYITILTMYSTFLLHTCLTIIITSSSIKIISITSTIPFSFLCFYNDILTIANNTINLYLSFRF